jgi:glycosyltransferase involved in cell wall biosynthesis
MSSPLAVSGPPRFSVVIPTTGSEAKLVPLLDGLARQTLPRDRFEIILAFDGATPTPAVAARMEALGVRTVSIAPRSGPPMARNRGATAARGEFIVWTEDDVVPEPDWLANADHHLTTEPGLDVLEGVTRKPGGRAVRIHGEEALQYLPCNLIVRRTLFERVGGFVEGYFEPGRGLYFREDADLGYALEQAGARVGRDETVVVVHPVEHPRFLDPIRWARRYVMDALLRTRWPRRYRERIEIHRLGPFRVRRPIVRACFAHVIAMLAALGFALARMSTAAWIALAVAVLAFVPVWAKWRFELRRLPVFVLVPWVLVGSYLRGFTRLAALGARRVEHD